MMYTEFVGPDEVVVDGASTPAAPGTETSSIASVYGAVSQPVALAPNSRYAVAPGNDSPPTVLSSSAAARALTATGSLRPNPHAAMAPGAEGQIDQPLLGGKRVRL